MRISRRPTTPRSMPRCIATSMRTPAVERHSGRGSAGVRLARGFDLYPGSPFLSVPSPSAEITDARILGLFGDFITTDHISPAGSIAANSPAARYLRENGVDSADFNSYGSRRGNHEVMMRGTFANVRLRNKMATKEGGWTRLQPGGEETSIYDAAIEYRQAGVPVVVIAASSTAPAAPATGRPRAPCCWVCAR